ncbi:family 43 glycosylhydrolase [Balneolales bacterium ANBcel1]|nr:family 43 glycosylhydrolase [Balneolales bacterium ANBcel1]
MRFAITTLLYTFLLVAMSFGQLPPSHQTFVNPVFPGDHPDPTLTKIGDYFYSSGSSFNVTPRIYRSSNLVHWEVIAQPVPFDWSVYGNDPGGGIWGGHMVYHHDTYWHYFGRGGGRMYFVTADDPEGPWSRPTVMDLPPGVHNLGVDNSIFIDEESGRWFLLTKAGHSVNHMVELGEDGQPTGEVLDLSWLNPAPDHPYGWAEGPVMWKYNGYYYYSFAEHLVGEQYVMRSEVLSDDPDDWEIMQGNMYFGSRHSFDRPNHISPAVTLDDGTSWAIGHSYHVGNWYAQGRQGLLHEVVYDDEGWPLMRYPTDNAETAPDLPSGGVPWMVPKSDMFNGSELDPEWSVLGETRPASISLNERPGWLYMEPYQGDNTVIKNDGEHGYSLITKVDFNPVQPTHEAGLWIFNGTETHFAKLYSSRNDEGQRVLAFSFQDIEYETPNTVGQEVWLKLVRNEHTLTGFYSADGADWTQIGESINVVSMDQPHPDIDFNAFTGNQQGLYVEGRFAFFNLYIYRDAYTDIMGRHAVNRSGAQRRPGYLGDIHNGDWALYAGVEFGDDSMDGGYQHTTNAVSMRASSPNDGGIAEVWLGAIETGELIAEVPIENTGSWSNYQTFSVPVDDVTGRHDVYLRFLGDEGTSLLRLQSFRFHSDQYVTSGDDPLETPYAFSLDQNYPNPFNPSTNIGFTLPQATDVSLAVYDVTGRRVASLLDGRSLEAGRHVYHFDGDGLASGVYIYRIKAGDFVQSRSLTLIR